MTNKPDLDAALNLLCKHVQDNLPKGWTIEVRMSSSESSIELYDPDCDEVQIETEVVTSVIGDACVTSWECS